MVGFNEEITKALPILLAGAPAAEAAVGEAGRPDVDVPRHGRRAHLRHRRAGLLHLDRYRRHHQAQSNNEAVTARLPSPSASSSTGSSTRSGPGIAGFFIGMALNYGRRRVQLIILGIAVPAVLHALNDCPRRLPRSGWHPHPGRVAAAVPRLHAVGGVDRAAGQGDAVVPRPVDDDGGHRGPGPAAGFPAGEVAGALVPAGSTAGSAAAGNSAAGRSAGSAVGSPGPGSPGSGSPGPGSPGSGS